MTGVVIDIVTVFGDSINLSGMWSLANVGACTESGAELLVPGAPRSREFSPASRRRASRSGVLGCEERSERAAAFDITNDEKIVTLWSMKPQLDAAKPRQESAC